jgi:DNA adenine methylase
VTNLLSLFEQLDDDEPLKRTFKREYINYKGSKREVLDQLLPLLPYFNSWVDVFGGSGAVTIARRPSNLDVYNDRNSGACAFFRAIKERPDELITQIELMPHAREFFVWARDTQDKDHDDVMRGAKWYYMVQASFSGKGDCFGRVTNGKNDIIDKLYKTLKAFPSIHKRFKQVQIENLDWRQIFADYDGPDVVFYCDPPYINTNDYKHNMTESEHIKMCDTIFGLSGFVALSGFENKVYDSYPWDGKHYFEISNRVFGSHNTHKDRSVKRTECLWIKEAT